MNTEQTAINEKVELPSGRDAVVEPGVIQELQPSDNSTNSVQLLSTGVGDAINAAEPESALHESLSSMDSNAVSIHTTKSLVAGDNGTDGAQSLEIAVGDEVDGSASQSKEETLLPADDTPSESRLTENLPAEDDGPVVRFVPVPDLQLDPAGSLVDDRLQENISHNGKSVDELTKCDSTHENETSQSPPSPQHKNTSSIEPLVDSEKNGECAKSESEPNHDTTRNSNEAHPYISPDEEGAKTQRTDSDHAQNLPSQATNHERLFQSLLQSQISGVEAPTEYDTTNVNVEFELDSSPIASSSSSDTSTDSSSSEDSDAEAYEMLDPAEQARRLMQEDGGSDDDCGGKSRNGAAVRTLNEKPDVIVPRPNLTITKDMKITKLGNVENLVENVVLIKARTSGEYQVLEYGSVLCLENRSVIGVIAETLGRVQQPYYSVRFTNAAAISELGISPGTMVLFVDQHSTPVFTQSLKAFKGSDASNLHDEEVGDAEVEFSDDEAEAEHKRRRKFAKCDRGQEIKNGFSQGFRQDHNNDASTTKPDDGDQDVELYTPLARPTNLHEIMGNNEAPIETQTTHHNTAKGRRLGTVKKVRGTSRGSRGPRGPRGSRNQRGRGSQHGSQHGSVDHGRIEKASENQFQPKMNKIQSKHEHLRSDERSALYSPVTQIPSLLEPTTPTMGPSTNLPTTLSPNHADPFSQVYAQEQQFRPQNDLLRRYQTQQQYSALQNSHSGQQHPLYKSYQAQIQVTAPANIPPGAFINPAFFPSGTSSLTPQRSWLPDPQPQIQQQLARDHQQPIPPSFITPSGQAYMPTYSAATIHTAQADLTRQGFSTFLPNTLGTAQQNSENPRRATHGRTKSHSDATLRAAQDLLAIQTLAAKAKSKRL